MYRLLLFFFGLTCIAPIIIAVVIEIPPRSFLSIGLVIMGVVVFLMALIGLMGSCGMHNNISMMFFQLGGILFCIIPWIVFLGFAYQNPQKVADSSVNQDKDKVLKVINIGRWGILVGALIQIATYVYCCFFSCCFMGRRKFYEDVESDNELAGRRVTAEESGYGELKR